MAASPFAPAASGLPVDQAQLSGPPAPVPTPPPDPGISRKTRIMIIGAIGLAVAASIGGAVWHGGAPAPPASSVGQTQPDKASAADGEVLKALDKAGQLTVAGRPSDAFGALRALSSGKPVGVQIPRLGHHESANIADPSGQMTPDQAKEKGDKVVIPAVVQVHSFRELERLNAAEKLTEVDTGDAFTGQERELISRLQGFEGGVPGAHVARSPLTNAVEYRYESDMPQPALLAHGHHSHFRAADRLTAFEALERLEKGEPVDVRSSSGLEQVVRKTSDLAALGRLESAQANPDAKSEVDQQEAIVRELAAGKKLKAGEALPDIARHQPLTGFQAVQMLQAGKPVVVDLGNGLSGTVTSLKDLQLFNAEEGITKTDITGTLNERELKTATELRAYEGRADKAGLFATRKATLGNEQVASSTRLNVRDARQRLAAGQPLAVRTQRGQIHVIKTVDELDTLARLVPAPPAPPAAQAPAGDSTAPATPTGAGTQ